MRFYSEAWYNPEDPDQQKEAKPSLLKTLIGNILATIFIILVSLILGALLLSSK